MEVDEGTIEEQQVATCRLSCFLLSGEIYVSVTNYSALMSRVCVFLLRVFVVVVWDWVGCVVFVYVINVNMLCGFLAGRWEGICNHFFVIEGEMCVMGLCDIVEGSF
jgi:ribose/xylose/arabinose/galactoside ABC-type transport system permease subunit